MVAYCVFWQVRFVNPDWALLSFIYAFQVFTRDTEISPHNSVLSDVRVVTRPHSIIADKKCQPRGLTEVTTVTC